MQDQDEGVRYRNHWDIHVLNFLVLESVGRFNKMYFSSPTLGEAENLIVSKPIIGDFPFKGSKTRVVGLLLVSNSVRSHVATKVLGLVL